jgi:hypothetical protein
LVQEFKEIAHDLELSEDIVGPFSEIYKMLTTNDKSVLPNLFARLCKDFIPNKGSTNQILKLISRVKLKDIHSDKKDERAKFNIKQYCNFPYR